MTKSQPSLSPEKGVIRLSEVLSSSLTKVYKAGKLALVFIFIGLLLITLAQINGDGKYSTITFILGVVLIFISFLLFLFVEIKTMGVKGKNIDKGKEIVDTLQDLSLSLISLTGQVQSFSFKYINDLDAFLSIGLPYLNNIPFIPDNIKNAGVKIQDIQTSIVAFSKRSAVVIKDVETALIKSDIKKFNAYLKELQKLDDQITEYLKK